ncbi:MAG: LysM domain-containing protein [Verrucomicrobiota bacterium]
MTDPQKALQALIQGGGALETRFPPTSRYHGVSVAVHTTADGTPLAHLKRRLVPPPEDFDTLQETRVRQGDRIDQLAARTFGDPEMYWQLCDANGALDPAELEKAEQTVRVPLPRGVSGGGAGAR